MAQMMPPAPPMGHNGGPPLEAEPGNPSLPGNGAPGGGLPPAAGQQPPQQAPQMPPQMVEGLATAVFGQCMELLKNDKMRTFRIDIETDSTVEVDRQAEKESVVELFTAVGGFLEKSVMVGQMMPE